ncbi:hypothetical protein AJ79_05735 [Helicocarpus griseus UAMH5409]|uniref:Rhodopsin domain-containing protein n=1 Tax=Helicocarpus griseus UAMH5409 TaxID=1447875 RepID=A0A2B7XJB2_9EURO|nr:hypothetical protein AJ79_05735 [Helicocarpus griseus UAMH5409]
MDDLRTIVGRMYSSDYPEKLAREDMMPTVLVSWWCTGFALAIIFVRILGRYIRTQLLFPEDWVMLIGSVPMLIRMGLVHVVLIYGTNNVDPAGLTADEIRRREIGSGLVLAARIFYTLFIWTAKFTVLEFFKRMTAQIWRRSSQLMLNFIRIFLAITFVGVLIAILAECQPFNQYWQVKPTPAPNCRQGYAHLVAMGTCDAITDILLVAFPIPIIVASTMPARRKFSLTLLFALSLILVVMTCYRIPAVIERHGNQQYRSLLASLEILAATAVSNVIVIGSFMRDRGVKKQKYKIGSVSDVSGDKFSRRATITHHQWGSDADLATDVGIRLDSETPSYQEIRPAPASQTNHKSSEKDGLQELNVTRDYTDLECNADLESGHQKALPRGAFGPIPTKSAFVPSGTTSNISPKHSPKHPPQGFLNDFGDESRQPSAATASTFAANDPTSRSGNPELLPQSQSQHRQENRRSRNFFETVTNFLSQSPRNSGSETPDRQPTSRNTSRPRGITGSVRQDNTLRLGSSRPADRDENQIEPADVERNLKLHDLGDLLSQDVEKNARP